MTTASRQVLDDCRGALAELTDGVQGGTWRRRWIIAVVLLRSVGYVLRNIDGATDPAHKTAIANWWSKPKPEIFRLFIERERNNILKLYEINAGQGATTKLRGVQTGGTEAGPPNPTIYHYPINAGHFKGRDQRGLILEAIEWWERELDAIDAEINRSKP